MKKYYLNYKLLLYIVLFFIISLVCLYSASKINYTVENLFYKQILWIIFGFIIFFVILKKGNSFIVDNVSLWYWLTNLLLLYLLIFGKEINNARCWIEIPGLGGFQPSEFMKIILIIFLAKIMAKKNKNNEFKRISICFIILFIPSLLTFLEPDTGAVIIYLVIMFFILLSSKISMKWIILGVGSISCIIGIILYLYFFNINLFIKILGNSFFLRVERILNWSSSSGMQLTRSLSSIGSAGLFGNGFLNTPIYFPESHTDFIFAVYSSNFGFVGSVILIFLISMFDFEIINIYKECKKKRDRYIVIGIFGILLYQQIQNISMTIGLLPITGITLPFISYGGSSLISYMILMGIIFNIDIYNKKNLRKS